jgi:hypothetical protein
MDWSIILGVLGIVVSVVVGWFTYRLADRRARNQKFETAKTTVLQELSKSLGEDAVPTPDVLEATIRSVLRETGDPKIEMNVDVVLDDLVRQVTSDPFLDSQRRRKLQADIQKVRTDAAAELKKRPREEIWEASPMSYVRSSLSATIPAMIAALLTLGAFLISIVGKGAESKFLTSLKDEAFLLPFLLMAVLLPILLITFLDHDMFRTLMRLFGRRDKK